MKLTPKCTLSERTGAPYSFNSWGWFCLMLISSIDFGPKVSTWVPKDLIDIIFCFFTSWSNRRINTHRVVNGWISLLTKKKFQTSANATHKSNSSYIELEVFLKVRYKDAESFESSQLEHDNHKYSEHNQPSPLFISIHLKKKTKWRLFFDSKQFRLHFEHFSLNVLLLCSSEAHLKHSVCSFLLVSQVFEW